ncbi:hypothetical protein PMAYCL1PPCAC_01584, partial [Pristionchus mayeri]
AHPIQMMPSARQGNRAMRRLFLGQISMKMNEESFPRKHSLDTDAGPISSTEGPSKGNKQSRPDTLTVDNSLQQMNQPHLPGTPADETTGGDVAVEIQKTNNDDNVFEIDSPASLTEPPSWSTLPAISRPFINRLCFHLRNDEECVDLANLAKVSAHFYTGVHNYMKKAENRPGFAQVTISNL